MDQFQFELVVHKTKIPLYKDENESMKHKNIIVENKMANLMKLFI